MSRSSLLTCAIYAAVAAGGLVLGYQVHSLVHALSGPAPREGDRSAGRPLPGSGEKGAPKLRDATQVGSPALAQRLQEQEGNIASLRSELENANKTINGQARQLADANSTIAMLQQKLAGGPSTGAATTVAVADPNKRSTGSTSTQTAPVTPTAVSLTAKVTEFPKLAFQAGTSYTRKPAGFTALCNAPPGASFRMVFPTELQDPLRYEASGGAFQIQFRPKGGDWSALGVAQVRNGELSWQWLEVDVGSNIATVITLGTVMQYAVLQAVDSTGKTIGELHLFDPANPSDELAQALTRPGFGPLKLTASLGSDPNGSRFYFFPVQVLRPGNLTSTDGNWKCEPVPPGTGTGCKSLLETKSGAQFTVELSPVDPLNTTVQVAWTDDSTVPEINKAIQGVSVKIKVLLDSNDQTTKEISGLSVQHRHKKDALEKGKPDLERTISYIEKEGIPPRVKSIGEKKDEIAKKMKLSDLERNLPRNNKGEIEEGKRNDPKFKADFDRWYARRDEVRKAQDENKEINDLADEVRQLEAEKNRRKEQLTTLQKEFEAIDRLLKEAPAGTGMAKALADLRPAQAEKSRLQTKLKDVTSPRTIVVKVPAATSKAILAEIEVKIPGGGG